MAMDAAELGRWMRFAAKGGIGRCVAIRDCEAQEVGDLMFLEGDEIIVLHQVPSPNTSTNDIPGGEHGGSQFLGYCEEIVGRFNARDVRFVTKLKKAVMTKRASSSSSPATLAGAGSAPTQITTSTSSSSAISAISSTTSTGGSSYSPTASALSPSPSTSSTVYTNTGLTSSPRASPAPSTFSTTSSSTLGIHDPMVRSASAASALSSTAPKSGLGLGMAAGTSMGEAVADTLERRSSAAAASASAKRTASPLQRSYTSPAPSVPPSTFDSASNSTLISGSSTLATSPTTSSFVSFSPTPSSVSPSPREANFPSSSASPVLTGSSIAASRSTSYSASSSARNSPSPALSHSRSVGGSSSNPSSPPPVSAPLSGTSSPSPRMPAQPLQPHSQQPHRYTAHAPSPLSFATASALSQRVSSTSTSSFTRASSASYSYSRSSSSGTPTSPAFSATGTLSPTSPAFSSSALSMGHDGLTPTTAGSGGALTPTNPLRITKRSPSLGHGHASGHGGMNIPGLRSPPPVSPLPELPPSASRRGSDGEGASSNDASPSAAMSTLASTVGSGSTPSVSPSVSDPPLTATTSIPPSRVASSVLDASPSRVALPPPALDLPSIADPIPPSPSSAGVPATGATMSSESPMNSAYAARMVFTPLPSSVGGFGAIAGHVEDSPGAGAVADAPARDEEVVDTEGQGRVMGGSNSQSEPGDLRKEKTPSPRAPSTTEPAMPSATANDIGLSLLQLQDLADGMYSYGSDSDSDSGSQYSRNSYAPSPRSGGGLESGPASRAASRSDGKVVGGVGVVDRNGRRKSLAPSAGGASVGGGKRATLTANPIVGSSASQVGWEDVEDDGGSEDGTVEGVAYDLNERKEGGDGDDGVGDAEAKALLAKMEEMNAMVAAMPAFPTKPSPGVVARSAVVPPPRSAGGSSSSAGSAAGGGRSGSHLSPTSPTFPQDTLERERRPSMVSAHSSHSVHSVRSGASGASGATSGSGEDYDIYDSYRYSRYSVLSGRSAASQAHTISSLPRAGGKRMDSMGSVDEGQEDQGGVEQGSRARGLDMVLDELSFGDEGVRGSTGAGPSHERTISVDSEASVYTQDSSEQMKEADTTILGASTGSTSSRTSTAAGVHATTATNRPAPLDLSKEASGPSKSVTSPLLHTSWGSATSSAKSSAAPFDVNNASLGLQAQSLIGALNGERAGEVKSSRAEVEERATSPGLATAMRQRIESEYEADEGDKTVSTIVDGAGIVIEDDEELPSRIEDDGLGMDDTMTSINTRRSSGSLEPEAGILGGLAPTLVISNRTPSPVDVGDIHDDAAAPVPAAVPRPPRSAGLSPFAASNQRRSIFLPHPGAPKAPSLDNAADSPPASGGEYTLPRASSPPPHGAQHPSVAHQHPSTHSSVAPIPRPNVFQIIQISLTTPPRPPPPILPGMRLPSAPLMRGPTIYGRTDVDLCASVGPVPISWSIDPFLVPPRSNSSTASGGVKGKPGSGIASQSQSQPSVGTGRGYPSRSMSTGASLASTAVPGTSSPLAKSAAVPILGATNQTRGPSVTITPASLAPPSISDTASTSSGVGGPGDALPRANFVPRAPGPRPRSRSFSGFNSTNDPADKKVSHEAPPMSMRTSNTSSPVLPVSSVSSTSTSVLSPSSSISPSPSLASSSSTSSSPASLSTPISKPPIPSAPKPIPKPPSGLTSKKPSSLSLRSSPLSTSLSVGGGLKSPKMPSSPLAMSVMVAQRDSVVSVSDAPEGGSGDRDKRNALNSNQLRLRAMGSMPNLGSTSTASFSSTLSPPPKSPSPLNTDSPFSTTRTGGASAPIKDDLIDAEVRRMSSSISTREPMSPPPFAGLPLLVPPSSQQQQSQGPSLPLNSGPRSPVSPSAQQPGFFPSHEHGTDGAQSRPQRQPSLRSKLSLPNLRRKQSHHDDDELDREHDIRGQIQPHRDRNVQREMDVQRRDQRERDDTLDVDRERELLQVRDLEFELVRPSLPAAQREWGAARTSEDSGVLGRDNGSFDYSGHNSGPFRGGDAASRGSFESRGSLDMQLNGAGRGDRTEGSRLRPTSPAFSIASGTPSSKSLPTQSGNSDSPTSPGTAGNASSTITAAEIEAHRARELRWLSLLASAPSSAGAAAYTLPASSTPSSSASSSTSPSNSSAVYTPNPLAKSRKTRKLLLEAAVPSSVRFRVWVFLTDARARAVPGVYDALVARGAGRVNGGVVSDIRRDTREEYERLAARATSPSLASRTSIPHIDDGIEDETVAAVKPFTPSQTGGDAAVTTLLLAYLNMVPDITYSRGLVHFLGHLLLLSPDEDAFWIFVSVMDSWLRGYFVVLPGHGMVNTVTPAATLPVAPQMDVDSLLFTRALEANEPQVAKRLLVDVGLSGVLICGPWFSSVFVGTLPVDILNRVWDLFLFEGIPLLIRVAIALVFCLKRHLLAPLPLASSISASSSLSSSSSGLTQSPHAVTLLSLLRTPPSSVFPPSPDTFISMALAVKLKDDDLRKQRVKMEQQVSLKMRQQASTSSTLAPPGHRPGSLRGSFQALRAGGSLISLPRASS